MPCPETPSSSWGGPNPEFTSRSLRYEYSSLVTPRSVYDLDLDTGDAVLRKRQPVLGDYDPDRYVTQRQWAVAPDGTKVPMSIVVRRDVARDGTAPCLLYGYGSYEDSMDPVFSSLRLSLLERGFVFAIAHVRGGGELGRHWYEDGKLLAKPNTFTDFVACARQLVDDRWTAPQRLVARGGSAGGLLVGAVANLAPELFGAMVAEVPFVDCLSTMLDDTLPLTVIEWEEWGNPCADPEVYAVMKSYTPYENVRSDAVPGHARHRRAGGPSGRLLGACQVGPETACRRSRRAGALQGRARLRPRRAVGALRGLARRGIRRFLRPRRRRTGDLTALAALSTGRPRSPT